MKKLGALGAMVGILFGVAVYFGIPRESPDTKDRESATQPQSAQVGPDDSKPDPKTQPDKSRVAGKEGPVTVSTTLSHPYTMKQKSQTVYATLDLKAEKVEGKDRPALNLAVVIDRSGSMQGKKVRYVKEAAHKIVNMLEGRDQLGIVTYADGASLDYASGPVTADNKEQMHAAIDSVDATGSTNISEAFQRAVDEVRNNQGEETVNRVILLSDGKPTAGIRDQSQLAGMAHEQMLEGVVLTTMGVGLDYNEDLMSQMAQKGGGSYYFIEKPDQTTSIFEDELAKLGSTVASDASAVLKLADGVTVEKVYGYPHRTKNGNVHISLTDFYGGQDKSVLLKLNVEPGNSGKNPVMDLDLDYTDVTRDRPIETSLSVSTQATDNQKKVRDNVDSKVMSRVQQIEVAQTLQTAMDTYKKGDAKAARKQLEAERKQLEEAKAQYNLPDEMVEKLNSELEKSQKKVKTHEPSSDSGKGAIKQQKQKKLKIMKSSGF